LFSFQRSRQRRIHAASEALWGEFAIHTPAPGEIKRLSRLLIHFPEEDQLVLRLEGDGKKNSYYGALYTQTNQEILQLEKEETFLEQTSFAISDSQTYQVRQIIQQRQLLLQRRDLLQRLLGRHRTTQSRQLTRTGLEAPSYFRDSVSA